MNTIPKPGTIFAAKFRVKTDNGDVVLAKVVSANHSRTKLLDLLTGNEREKQTKDLLKRNHVVSKATAKDIMTVFWKKGRAAAREAAVASREHGRKARAAA